MVSDGIVEKVTASVQGRETKCLQLRQVREEKVGVDDMDHGKIPMLARLYIDSPG
jgi:hypothetical protein